MARASRRGTVSCAHKGAQDLLAELNEQSHQTQTDLRVGENPQFMTEFYQPIGYSSDWFVAPRLLVERRNFDIIDEDERLACAAHLERARAAGAVIVSGSTILIFQGSAQDRRPDCWPMVRCTVSLMSSSVARSQLGCGARQVQPADRHVVDASPADDRQVELQVVRENRPNDIPVGHDHDGGVVDGGEGLFHCRHRPLLHLA